MKTNYSIRGRKYINKLKCGTVFFFLVFAFLSCKKDFNKLKLSSESNNNGTSLTSKPNILLIVGDDIGFEVPTCDGGQSYSTPNIDRIARDGRLFTQCHSSPMCSPSRFMLLTGKYNFRNYTEWGHMDISQRTIGNMLSDAGYATCYTGKWQLDGGDNSIRTFGWKNYSVWLPYLLDDESLEGSRYKSPKVYQDGGYLPAAATQDKFSEDIFTSYGLNFIDSMHKANKPFFLYYSMILSHGPFSPTPDDPQYATWDFQNQKSDVSFFPSMVKYMDKKIGQIFRHMDSTGELNNTIILYIGDNGTPPHMVSKFNGFSVAGGKKTTTEIGTSVPLITLWKGVIPAGTSSNALIDFTDFLPTLAEIAGTSKPTTYGTLDGVSFGPELTTSTDTIRSTIYDCYAIAPLSHPFTRWVQNDSYKLYDTNAIASNYRFVKITKCRPDTTLTTLTAQEKTIKRNFIKVLRSYN